MKHNMGRKERWIRVSLGILFVLGGWVYLANFGIFSAAAIILPVGAILILTGFYSFCPAYELFHHTSCKMCRNGITDRHLPV